MIEELDCSDLEGFSNEELEAELNRLSDQIKEAQVESKIMNHNIRNIRWIMKVRKID